jgi:hypothetical protein
VMPMAPYPVAQPEAPSSAVHSTPAV